MKCHFCNWDNPEGSTKCEKCGHELQPDATESSLHVHERPTTRKPMEGSANNLKKTINENEFRRQKECMNETISEGEKICPLCHHELEDGECPSCGYDSKSKNNVNNNEKPVKMNLDGKKTVRPHRKGEKGGRFILTPISEDTGQPEGDFIQFDGNEIELNRDNTDPKNDTITSQQQAIISHEDGKWNILDQSEYKTTFVQAARKIELQNGDLILLGNQLFRFDSITE